MADQKLDILDAPFRAIAPSQPRGKLAICCVSEAAALVFVPSLSRPNVSSSKEMGSPARTRDSRQV